MKSYSHCMVMYAIRGAEIKITESKSHPLKMAIADNDTHQINETKASMPVVTLV